MFWKGSPHQTCPEEMSVGDSNVETGIKVSSVFRRSEMFFRPTPAPKIRPKIQLMVLNAGSQQQLEG